MIVLSREYRMSFLSLPSLDDYFVAFAPAPRDCLGERTGWPCSGDELAVGTIGDTTMEALVRDYFSDESHGQDWSRTLGPLLEALNNTTDDADTAAIDRLILALEEAAVTGVEWETRTVALLRALLLTQSPHKDNHDHRPSLLLARLQSRPSSGNDAQMAKAWSSVVARLLGDGGADAVLSASVSPPHSALSEDATASHSERTIATVPATERSRWSVSRGERQRLIRLMDHARDDQKRQRRQVWCRLELSTDQNEFDELWKEDTELSSFDMRLMQCNQQLFDRLNESHMQRLRETEREGASLQDTERLVTQSLDTERLVSQSLVTERLASQSLVTERTMNQLRDTERTMNQLRDTERTMNQLRDTERTMNQLRDTERTMNQLRDTELPISQPRDLEYASLATKRPRSPSLVIDFDCIFRLLDGLSNDSATRQSVRVLLAAADSLLADRLFSRDLLGFDQPHHSYYCKDDDGRDLNGYDFEGDDLGRFARGRSYRDGSKKFYRQRAYRFRFLASQSPAYFFSGRGRDRMMLDGELQRIRRKSSEFDSWHRLISSDARRGSCFVTRESLLWAIALALVLHVPCALDQTWSTAKYGEEWTLRELGKTAGGTGELEFVSTDRYSSLWQSARALSIPCVLLYDVHQ